MVNLRNRLFNKILSSSFVINLFFFLSSSLLSSSRSTALVDQIRTIKKTSEARLEMMKKEVISVEGELEEVRLNCCLFSFVMFIFRFTFHGISPDNRSDPSYTISLIIFYSFVLRSQVRYTASLAGVTTNKEYKKQLGEKQSKLRQVKEKTEAIEQLQQRVVAGLAHISDILFIPKSEDDAPVSDLHKNIEAVLDTLINEREKQLQQQQQGQAQQQGVDSQSKMANTRDSGSVVSRVFNFWFCCSFALSTFSCFQSGIVDLADVHNSSSFSQFSTFYPTLFPQIPEAYTNRSPELDFVIAKHEAPTVRLPARLPSKPTGKSFRFFLYLP